MLVLFFLLACVEPCYEDQICFIATANDSRDYLGCERTQAFRNGVEDAAAFREPFDGFDGAENLCYDMGYATAAEVR